MRADRSADISTSIIPKDPIRALTKRRRIKPTSPRCPSAWQPNPGRGSTYRRGNSVQTTGTISLVLIPLLPWPVSVGTVRFAVAALVSNHDFTAHGNQTGLGHEQIPVAEL